MKAPLLVTSDCERAPSDSCPARWAMQPEGRTGMCHPHALLSRAMVHWALGQTLLLGPPTEAVQGPRPLLPLHTLSGPAPYPGPQYLPCPWCRVKLCVPGSAPAVCIFLWPLRHNTPGGARLSPGAEGPTSWGCLMQSGSSALSLSPPAACCMPAAALGILSRRLLQAPSTPR